MTPEDLKIVKIDSGEQICCYLSVADDSKFVRLIEPLEVRTHTDVGEMGNIIDQISLVEWIVHSSDNMFSIHRDRLVTIAKADSNLIEYYGYTKRKIDQIKKEKLEDLKLKKDMKNLKDTLEKGKDKRSRRELLDIMSGNITKH